MFAESAETTYLGRVEETRAAEQHEREKQIREKQIIVRVIVGRGRSAAVGTCMNDS